jgi:hypothetical protein
MFEIDKISHIRRNPSGLKKEFYNLTFIGISRPINNGTLASCSKHSSITYFPKISQKEEVTITT